MSLDQLPQIAQQAVEFAKEAGEALTAVAGPAAALWSWIKSRFGGNEIVKATIEQIEQSGETDEAHWETLQGHLKSLLSKQPELAEELRKLLPDTPQQSQSIDIGGSADGAQIAQVEGNDNQTSLGGKQQ